MKSKKKAFTLTELLIVVMVIGVLSAVVLPKFNKVIETRKTTEAEEMLAAVRTEQEQRCALNKPYAGTFAQMGEVTSGLDNRGRSKNFTYSFVSSDNGIGMQAKRGNNYTLKMPSYADGRICCEGAGCSSLNKDYPLCNTLVIASADKKVDTQCAPVCSGSAQTRNCACDTGYTSNSGYSTDTEQQRCVNGNWEWPGARCKSRAGCRDVNACTGSAPTYTCDCAAGWSGTSTATENKICQSGHWVIPSPKCTSTQGCTKLCTGSAPTYTCDCASGWSGTSTATGNKVCDNGNWVIPSPKCTSTQGCTKNCTGSAPSYTCDCASGYHGTSTATGSKVCQNGSWVIPSPKCTSTQGCCSGNAPTYNCDCQSGYTGTCTDTGSKTCSNGSWVIPSPKCKGTSGCCSGSAPTYYCDCSSGYTSSSGHSTKTGNKTCSSGSWVVPSPKCKSTQGCTATSTGTGTGTGTSGSGSTTCNGYSSGYQCYKADTSCCIEWNEGGGTGEIVVTPGNMGGKTNMGGFSSLPSKDGRAFSFYYAAADHPGGGGPNPPTPPNPGRTCKTWSTHRKYECQSGSWGSVSGGCVRQVAGHPNPLCPAGV